jgi:diaminopimelate decarboxylase
MNGFNYQTSRLHCEDYPLDSLAKDYGTPCFVYSASAMASAYHAIKNAFEQHKPLICYAVKANSNLTILKLLSDLGAGFDIVSGGELGRVLRIGADPSKVVFSGVGKQADEIEAALAANIKCFNVESEAELHHIAEIATRLGTTAPISLRVNPDVDPKTHPYISTGLKESKFGIPMDQALQLYRTAQTLTGIAIKGIDCHIGSQITQLAPYLDALDKMFELIDQLADQGIALEHFDIGGGMGVRYEQEPDFPLQALSDALQQKMADRDLRVILEPGRYIIANAGVLLTEVLYTKHNATRAFAVVDAAMNDLIRPALYDAVQAVHPVVEQFNPSGHFEIVGPICEAGDFLAKHCLIDLEQGALIALATSGAYGMSMSSNYNTRCRAAEVLVHGGHAQLIRRRETIQDLLAAETNLDTSTTAPNLTTTSTIRAR